MTLKPKSSQSSFYGEQTYDRIIPDDHFLKLLDRALDFSFASDLYRDIYNPEIGRPACAPRMMFKMLFLQFLYNISDRSTEEEVNFHLVLKWSVKLLCNRSICGTYRNIQQWIDGQFDFNGRILPTSVVSVDEVTILTHDIGLLNIEFVCETTYLSGNIV